MKKIFIPAAFLLLLASCSTESNEPIEEKNILVPKEETQDSTDLSKQDSVEVQEELLVNSWLKFKGTMFDVEYPEGFIASPTQPTFELEGVELVDTDEAYFASPDSSVIFFVYSPQWSGFPENYMQKRVNEVLVDENKSEEKDGYETTITESASFKDSSGLYHRAYVSITTDMDGSETKKVFGIQYKDQESYDLYREAYKKFKKSLNQYAD